MAQKNLGAIQRMEKILKILKQHYPEAKCSLDFENPFQLLIATILSAQCTDERVNKVTPGLFKEFKTPQQFAQANRDVLESLIRSTNFFKNKAHAIQEASRVLVEEFGGEVPPDLEKLIQLRGVGRKTANVVLGNAFGIPGIPVDTHAKRVSYRMGFTESKVPEKVEQDLMKVVPKSDWCNYTNLVIAHGRKICTARKAYCEKCPITDLCPKIGLSDFRVIRSD
jgi:endonuclease III